MQRTIKLIFLFSIFIFSIDTTFAQTSPTYTLKVKNINHVAQDSLTFDIYMRHTNSGSTNFEYAIGQYYLNFNPLIANSGVLTYRIIASDLPVNARPRNPNISGSQLRLVANAVLGAGNGPAISNDEPGTLIVRMSLRTSAAAFAQNQNLNLAWRNPPTADPVTKIFAYVGTTSTDITTPNTHTIDDPMSITNLSTEIPDEYNLSQNYPNPFNPSTKINFALPVAGIVTLNVYDIAGREVISLLNEKLNAGVYEYLFDASNLSSGIYFYRLISNDFVETRRMILLK